MRRSAADILAPTNRCAVVFARARDPAVPILDWAATEVNPRTVPHG
jgi:hypothetical protein